VIPVRQQNKNGEVNMKTFKVFRHPTLGFQAVKEGFSWPGFFFGPIWAFAKKLWGYAFLITATAVQNK
jgi:hypothetical protein